MNISGKVIQVAIDVDVKKKDGGTYKGWKLVYEQSDGEVKTLQKHMNSLKYAAPLANGLKELKAGDTFTMEMEKEGDFWNPKSVFKSEPGATGLKGAEDPQYKSAQQAKTASSSDSKYATKEERDQTQKYIVRQSSITSALRLLEVTGVKKATTNDVIKLAVDFEAFVMGYVVPGVVEEDKTPSGFDDMDDDIPF